MSIVKRVSENESTLIDFLRVNKTTLNSIASNYQNYFLYNLLKGSESETIQIITDLFMAQQINRHEFFLEMNEKLIKNSLKVLKRLMGEDASFSRLNDLIQNTNGAGKQLVSLFKKLEASEDNSDENESIAAWFMNDYYNQSSKMFEYCISFRAFVSKLMRGIEPGKLFDSLSNGEMLGVINLKPLELAKLIGKLSNSDDGFKTELFSKEDILIILDKLITGNNISIIGSAGTGKTVLIRELLKEMNDEFEIMHFERGYRVNDNKITEIKEFIDNRSNKPKLLILDDADSFNMVANIDYALRNGLQIIISTQYNSLRNGWKEALMELYYPKSNLNTNTLATNTFYEFLLSKKLLSSEKNV